MLFGLRGNRNENVDTVFVFQSAGDCSSSEGRSAADDRVASPLSHCSAFAEHSILTFRQIRRFMRHRINMLSPCSSKNRYPCLSQCCGTRWRKYELCLRQTFHRSPFRVFSVFQKSTSATGQRKFFAHCHFLSEAQTTGTMTSSKRVQGIHAIGRCCGI